MGNRYLPSQPMAFLAGVVELELTPQRPDLCLEYMGGGRPKKAFNLMGAKYMSSKCMSEDHPQQMFLL